MSPHAPSLLSLTHHPLRLPPLCCTPVKGIAPSFNSNTPVAGIGPAGSVSSTYLPSSSLDVPPLMQYGMYSLPLVGSSQSPLEGLYGQFSYNLTLGSTVGVSNP